MTRIIKWTSTLEGFIWVFVLGCRVWGFRGFHVVIQGFACFYFEVQGLLYFEV